MSSHPYPSDNPDNIRQTIKQKPALRAFYIAIYKRYQHLLSRCPAQGIAIELGSGCGFLHEVADNIITSDVTLYPGVERVEDATSLNFPDNSLRAIVMVNVFHHIGDVDRFFNEASRCLVTGGRVLIIDHYRGLISTPIFKWFHHENWKSDAKSWKFSTHDPYNDANSALSWIVFMRDRKLFEEKFPSLIIARITPHTPLLYWLSGGLKRWTFVTKRTLPLAKRIDHALLRLSSKFGSFADIELVKE